MARSRDGLYRRENRIFAFRYKDRNGAWREKYAGTDNRDDAKAFRDTFLAQLKANTLPTSQAKRTVDQACRAWLDSIRPPEVEANTHRSYRACLSPIARLLGARKLGDVGIEDLKTYRSARRKEGRANRTINHEILCLSYVMKQAKLWAPIAQDYKPLPESSKHSSRRPLTMDQLNSLVRTAMGNKHWTVVLDVMLVAANTTCRPCEITGLQLGRIRQEGKSPRIVINRVTTKTDAGEREIPLNRVAALAMKRLVERAVRLGADQPEHYLLPADLSKHTREFICMKKCECKGKGCAKGSKDPLYARRMQGFDPTISQRGWDTAWCKLRTKAGLPGAQFYQLRHTSITAGAEENVPVGVMKALAGHMDTHMTEYYTSVRDNPKAKAVAAIENGNPELLGILGLNIPVGARTN